MSLINRMLGELAARQAPGTETLDGVRLSEPLAEASKDLSMRTVLLTVGIAVGIAALAWWLWPRQSIPLPQPRGLTVAIAPPSQAAAIIEEQAPLAEARAAEAAAQPTTTVVAGSVNLRMDASLHAPGAAVASLPVEPEPAAAQRPTRASRASRSAAAARGLSQRLSALPPTATRLDHGGIQAADTNSRSFVAQPADSPRADPSDATRQARDALARGEPAAALHALEGASDAESVALRAAALQRLGRHVDAAALYRSLTLTDPNEAGHWVGLAISLEGQQRRDEAGAAYRRALESPGLAPTLQKYARQRLAALGATP